MPALPKVRPARFDGTDVPVHWFHGNAFLTHSVNALNLIFPDGERFFVRSVRHYLDRIEDEELLARVKGFIGQETQHGRAHEATADMLRAQGFDVDAFLRAYRRVAYAGIERLSPPLLRLSVTVALEHLTATMAEDVLRRGTLAGVHPALRDLLEWHAAEEIEHKSVAFDVLAEVDDRYLVRVVGMVLALSLLLAFWSIGARTLVRQDPAWSAERRPRDEAEAWERGHGRQHIFRAFLSYFRPGFHPEQQDNTLLATAWLAAHRPEVIRGAA